MSFRTFTLICSVWKLPILLRQERVGIVIQLNKESNVIKMIIFIMIKIIFTSMITSKCLVNAISLPPFAYRFWKLQ